MVLDSETFFDFRSDMLDASNKLVVISTAISTGKAYILPKSNPMVYFFLHKKKF